jgi:hypothetical protein
MHKILFVALVCGGCAGAPNGDETKRQAQSQSTKCIQELWLAGTVVANGRHWIEYCNCKAGVSACR